MCKEHSSRIHEIGAKSKDDIFAPCELKQGDEVASSAGKDSIPSIYLEDRFFWFQWLTELGLG